MKAGLLFFLSMVVAAIGLIIGIAAIAKRIPMMVFLGLLLLLGGSLGMWRWW